MRPLMAWLLLFVLALLAIPAQVHSHGPSADPHHLPAAAASCEGHGEALPDPLLSASDCALCDFAATLVTPAGAVPTPVVLPHFAEAPPAPRPLRASPYRPLRFCDRSASRAPPAAV